MTSCTELYVCRVSDGRTQLSDPKTVSAVARVSAHLDTSYLSHLAAALQQGR